MYDGSDTLLMRFEYADGRMPVAMSKGGFTYYLTYDQVGSLRVIADSSGNVVKKIEYDSFGNIINDTDPSFAIPFGFAGGLYDKDTGLIRFGFRDYDPDVGRWTGKDPIFFAGGDTDLFGYCLNDPVNSVDSDGLIFGSLATKLAGKIVGASAQEAGIAGKVADSVIGSAIGLKGIPGNVSKAARGALTALEGWGAWQTATLAILSIGAAPAWVPVALAGLAGVETGLFFNDLYRYFSGQMLGEDIYDWFHPEVRKESPC